MGGDSNSSARGEHITLTNSINWLNRGKVVQTRVDTYLNQLF